MSALVWVVVGVRLHGVVEHILLLLDVTLDSALERRVADLVGAVRQGGEEAAGELVLALRAGLEESEATLDGELYRLVVAELEVQVAPLFGGAPVAAVERPVLEEVERASDRAARRLACPAPRTNPSSDRSALVRVALSVIRHILGE